MKKVLTFALSFCLVASALSVVAFAYVDTSWTENDHAKSVSELLKLDYIVLGIAILGLIATIVSAILLAKDRKKERNAEKLKGKDDGNRSEKK